MQAKHFFASLFFVVSLSQSVYAEEPGEYKRWSVGTSAWVFANLLPDSPQFYYIEVDRKFSAKHELVIEPLTWSYRAPVGIPYGSSFGDSKEEYPGFVRSIGVGVGWRYYLYRGLNVSARGYNFMQIYSEKNKEREYGYQLFLQTRLGWRLSTSFGLWVEPALAANWWPIEVGRPKSFKEKDDRWPNYFLPELWLNVGWQW